MVRLSDLPDFEAEHLRAKDCPRMPHAWVEPAPPLARRVALITTAGVHCADEDVFRLADATYRIIPGDADLGTIRMSHASANFDRTGFQEDINVVLPIDRFRSLETDGRIGSLGSFHVSFMGAGLEPDAYEGSVRTLAKILRQDGVNTAFLTPV